MLEYQGFRVQMYPTEEQEKLLKRNCGYARYMYNWAVNAMDKEYETTKKTLRKFDLTKMFTSFRNLPEMKWLLEYCVTPARFAIFNARQALTNFLKNPKFFNRPKFKSKKDDNHSFTTRAERMYLSNYAVRVEGLPVGDRISLRRHNIPIGSHVKYCRPTISYDGVNWWFSIQVQYNPVRKVNHNPNFTEPIGIDVGIKTLAYCSNGMTFNYPKKSLEKAVKRIKQRQRRQDKSYRKYLDIANRTKTKYEDIPKSKNMQKRAKELRKAEIREVNIRKNTRRHIVSTIIKENPIAVIMEGLNVVGMTRNKHLSRSIYRAAWTDLKEFMKYKCDVNDIEFIEVSMHFPSSKRCSCCGNIKRDLTLDDRTYRCEACGLVIDRDYNAALNLKSLYIYRKIIKNILF